MGGKKRGKWKREGMGCYRTLHITQVFASGLIESSSQTITSVKFRLCCITAQIVNVSYTKTPPFLVGLIKAGSSSN